MRGMETYIYTTSEDDIKAAAKVIAEGGLVAFPTETVYGLGADAFDPDAAKKAYAAKGRPSDNPLIVHIADFQDLYLLTTIFDEDIAWQCVDPGYSSVSNTPDTEEHKVIDEHQIQEDQKRKACTSNLCDIVKKLSDAFWPGPLTMVLPKRKEVPKETTGGLDTVAVRMPASEPTLELIRYSGTLVSGPSANLSGRPSPTAWIHVKEDLDGKIDGIIAGDPCQVGIESTVLDVKTMTILRPGFITPEMIAAVTGCEVSYDKTLFSKPSEDPNFHPMAPGQKYKHYAPKAEMHIVPEEKLMERVKEERSKGKKVGFILRPEARTFFAKLREFDDQGMDIILASALPEGDSLSFSIMNRVLKSAGYHIEG